MGVVNTEQSVFNKIDICVALVASLICFAQLEFTVSAAAVFPELNSCLGAVDCLFLTTRSDGGQDSKSKL